MAPHPKSVAQGTETDSVGMKDRGELSRIWGRAQSQVSDCPFIVPLFLHFLWVQNTILILL